MSMKTLKHEEVTTALRELAASLTPGERFPTHREVMRRFQVSVRTALRSLEELQRAGWIVRRGGVGTFVADPRDATPRDDTPTDAPARPTGSGTLLVFALSDSPFFQNAVDVIAAQAAAAGLAMVCHYVRREAPNVDLAMVDSLRPEGVLVFGYLLENLAVRAQEREARAVLVGVPPTEAATAAVPCIHSDHEHGGYLTARRLLDLGHRRIGFAHENCRGSDIRATYRWEGFRRALTEVGAPSSPEAILLPTAETIAWRTDPANAIRFFARPDAPTAIACWNDREARGLRRALRRAGVRIPQDVSLIGYDNDPTSADLEPPLDTIDQHVEVQVRLALRLLTASPIAGKTNPAAATVVVPTLVTRASCAAPTSIAPDKGVV